MINDTASDDFCNYLFIFFFFNQKTAYEMRMSDWSSDVCSSDLLEADTDLKMPATRAGWLGIVSGLCFAVAVAILAFTTLAPPLRIFAAGASAYAGLWLRHLDRRRLPRRCDTIGDLARLVTEQNRGR